MVSVLISQSVVAGVFQQFGQQYKDLHCHATTQHFFSCPGTYSELSARASHAASHCNLHWLSFLIMLKDWSLQIPEQHEHNFS
jgi:hypothetical protein